MSDLLYGDGIYLEIYRTPEREGRVFAYYCRIFRRSDGAFIGYCDLRLDPEDPAGNVSYRIFPKYRGCGSARRAVLLLCQLAKKHGLDEINIVCLCENAASRKVCESLKCDLGGIKDIADCRGSIVKAAIYKLKT